MLNFLHTKLGSPTSTSLKIVVENFPGISVIISEVFLVLVLQDLRSENCVLARCNSCIDMLLNYHAVKWLLFCIAPS